MPIYAYKCESCGHGQDVLQKIADPLLTQCPACGAAAFTKQITAAGFQLKGSGWYATDFRNNGAKPPAAAEGGEKPADQAADKSADKPADKTADKTTDKAAASDKPAPGDRAAAAPAAASSAPGAVAPAAAAPRAAKGA